MWHQLHGAVALLLLLPTSRNPTEEVTGVGIGADTVSWSQESSHRIIQRLDGYKEISKGINFI